ncbi:MAG: hypothetical protein JWM93_941 [Frankiales bacterium]|nr:hypothetical protein [Frankiales bacterium]
MPLTHALVATLTVGVLGCAPSGAQPAPAPPGHSTFIPSATASASASHAASSGAHAQTVRDVDWRNATLPTLCDKGGQATLWAGEARYGDLYTIRFRDVWFGTLSDTRDRDYAVVTTDCMQGHDVYYGSTTLVYGNSPAGPRLLGFLAPGYELGPVAFEDGRIVAWASPNSWKTLAKFVYAVDDGDGLRLITRSNHRRADGADISNLLTNPPTVDDIAACAGPLEGQYDTGALEKRLEDLGGVVPKGPAAPEPSVLGATEVDALTAAAWGLYGDAAAVARWCTTRMKL